MPSIHALLTAFAITCVAAPALAAQGEALPSSQEAWVQLMLNARKNGVAFKDPAAFLEWLDAISEPRFMTALASAAAKPNTYPEMLSNAFHPEAARNWAEFVDPQLYMRWMLAGATPSFQQAIIKKLTNPDKMKHWIDALRQTTPNNPVRKTRSTDQSLTQNATVTAQSRWLQLPDPGVGVNRYRY